MSAPEDYRPRILPIRGRRSAADLAAAYKRTVMEDLDRVIDATLRHDWSEVAAAARKMTEPLEEHADQGVSEAAQLVCDEACKSEGQGVKRSVLRLIGVCGRLAARRAIA